MKKNIIVATIISILIISAFVIAKPNTDRVPATNTKSDIPLFIPSHAVQMADHVFSLGLAQDENGEWREGRIHIFLDQNKQNAKPGNVCGDNICGPGEKKSCPADCGSSDPPTGSSSCYATYGKGVVWKSTEPYVTGPGIDLALTELSLNTWDKEVGFNIFGIGSSGNPDGADDVAPDGINEVLFENLGPTNTIAYTITWGIFSGPPNGRLLSEWDMVFNAAYNFGNAGPTDENNLGNTNIMDYQNIAVHEAGHALGLAHPDGSCTEETMYAYATEGETKKRTLEAGDLTGLKKQYS